MIRVEKGRRLYVCFSHSGFYVETECREGLHEWSPIRRLPQQLECST